MTHLLRNPPQHSGPLGYTEADVRDMPPCYGCDAGMQTRTPSGGSWDDPRPMCDSICCTDTYGQTLAAAFGGFQFYQITVGRRSRLTSVKLMRRVTEAHAAVEAYFGKSARMFR